MINSDKVCLNNEDFSKLLNLSLQNCNLNSISSVTKKPVVNTNFIEINSPTTFDCDTCSGNNLMCSNDKKSCCYKPYTQNVCRRPDMNSNFTCDNNTQYSCCYGQNSYGDPLHYTSTCKDINGNTTPDPYVSAIIGTYPEWFKKYLLENKEISHPTVKEFVDNMYDTAGNCQDIGWGDCYNLFCKDEDCTNGRKTLCGNPCPFTTYRPS